MNKGLKITVTGILVLGLISFGGCTKDNPPLLDENGEIIPEGGRAIVSGNPELNDFLITSKDESIFVVDAKTGQEEEIFTFADLTDFDGVADYDNGNIYVTTDDNAINAVDKTAKNLLWDTPLLEYDFASLGLSSTICLEGVCYASGGYGVVVAVDENTGDLKWYYSTDVNGELDNVLNEAGTPIVGDTHVYVFSEEGFISDHPAYMHVLNKETGERERRFSFEFDISGTPSLVNDILYIPAGNLYAVDVNTFDVLWIFEANEIGTPFISGDRLVVQAVPSDRLIESFTYCLDANTGNKIWEKDSGFDTIYSPIIVENVVFGVYEKASNVAFDDNGRPFAVSLSDGEELWYNDDLSIDHSPVYANGRLFFHGHDILRTDEIDGNVGLIAVDANTGETLWLNTFFRFGSPIPPTVVAQNGVFSTGYFRGN